MYGTEKTFNLAIDTVSGDTSNDFSTITGGASNRIVGNSQMSTIGGGDQNQISDGSDNEYSTIAGGQANSVQSKWGAIGGGEQNTIYSRMGTIAGGDSNIIHPSSDTSAISGGAFNAVSGAASVVSGGTRNAVSGSYSAIAGGEQLTVGSNSFGFNANYAADVSASSNTAYLGNVNLWIGSTDNSAHSVRFYSPNINTTYTGAHYSSFQATSQPNGNILYTLPDTAPAFAGEFLMAQNVTTVSGGKSVQLGWDTVTGAGGGLTGNFWALNGNAGTNPGSPKYNFLGTQDSASFEIHVLDTGAATGGDKRVMQYSEGPTSPNILGGSSSNSIGSGLSGASVLSGGTANAPLSNSSNLSVIAGGEGNEIDTASHHSIIGGGESNYISAPFCFIGGGGGTLNGGPNQPSYQPPQYQSLPLARPTAFALSGPAGVLTYRSNQALAPWATIGGGYENFVSDTAGTTGGGAYNGVASDFGTIAGGYNNYITPGAEGAAVVGGANGRLHGPFEFVGAGYGNATTDTASLVVAGVYNTNDGNYSAIVGGLYNYVRPSYSFLGGGYYNVIDLGGDTSVLVGGADNLLSNGSFSFLGGGLSDTITSTLSVIVGGCFNKVLATKWGTITGGCTNIITDTFGFIGGGAHNTDSAYAGTITGGNENTITANGVWSSIGGGSFNLLSPLSAGFAIDLNGGIFYEDFPQSGVSVIGGGSLNKVKGSRSFLGGGQQNTIDSIGTCSVLAGGFENGVVSALGTIGGGYLDSMFSPGDFIGGGYQNRASGETSAIPGGDHLIAQSYAQFVAGSYNIAQGSSTPGLIKGDDFLAIFGDGTSRARSNAAEISYSGHIIAHHDLGHTSVPSTYPIVGATYEDNTIIAWGQVSAAGGLLHGIGYKVSAGSVPGTYIVKLFAQDSKGDTIPALSNVSITASLINNDTTGTTGQPPPDGGSILVWAGGLPDSAVCGKIVVSDIGIFAPPNQNVFIVHTYNSFCQQAPEPFYFKVCGNQ